jgi:hypothetical protein
MPNPCPENVSSASGGTLSEAAAARLLQRLRNLAQERAAEQNISIETALNEIAGELAAEERLSGEHQVRNLLLDVKARRNIKQQARKHKTLGEGLLAVLEGSQTKVEGSRMSVDAQAKAIHHKYVGRLVAELEQAELLHDFRTGKLAKEVYIEMGEIQSIGRPGRSGSVKAQRMAAIIESVTSEMVGRQNRTGALIDRLPGYVVRQTHDMDEIRRLGGYGPDAKSRSYAAWSEFTLPLLNRAKTMAGEDPQLFMRHIHEGLYTGTHGADTGEFDVMVTGVKPDISKNVSKSRVLHFIDAEAAWRYNERFGMRNLMDQVFSDIFYRSRSIALMENLGPSVERNLERLMRELREEARVMPNAAEQTDSLNDWRIPVAIDIATGKVDVPKHHGLSKVANVIRSMAIVTKMGSTVISALSDRVFMNQELAFQGISRVDRWSQQLKLARSPQQKQALRLMGIGLDGIIGSTVARYTSHASVAGLMHRMQQKMFDLNFMNWWTDTSKSAAAELMSAHLGEHSHLSFEALPGELGHILSLFNITRTQWDAMRSTAYDPSVLLNDNSGLYEGKKFISADQLSRITDEQIDAILHEKGLNPTQVNRTRARDQLDTALRSYFSDRVDAAIPTPGAAEKKYTTFGTQAGTPLGEAVRMLTMFKSFPITIMTKVLSREVYGRGNSTVAHWLKTDHKGKFNLAIMFASAIAAGYMSESIRDVLKGREPKRLLNEDGSINTKTLTSAALRSGAAGLMGDYLFNEYDRGYKSFSASLMGPVLGQLDPMAEISTLARNGEYDKALDRSGKFFLDNTPFINLFYIRPVLDYFIFWNLQEFLDPGSLRQTEEAVKKKTGQEYWARPSELVK